MKKSLSFLICFFLVFGHVTAQKFIVDDDQILANQFIRINPSDPNNDSFKIVNQLDNVASNVDLMWVAYWRVQPNNPSIMSLSSLSAWGYNACFRVCSNGNVGIFNQTPSVALEVGSASSIRQVKVNGNLVFGSDARMKKNIKDVSSSLNRITQLQPVTYNFVEKEEKQEIPAALLKKMSKEEVDSMNVEIKNMPKNNQEILDRNIYGFLAQDVEKLFPDLVYKDSAGIMSIDYIGIIPLLVDAVREQQTQITDQNQQIAKLINSLEKQDEVSVRSDKYTVAYLEQNNPNPFNQLTEIKYHLPESVINASLCVYDLQGKQLKQIRIAQRGDGAQTISASEFAPGIYLYALIADGKEVDVKRMILTE